jgi:hypothetical protein
MRVARKPMMATNDLTGSVRTGLIERTARSQGDRNVRTEELGRSAMSLSGMMPAARFVIRLVSAELGVRLASLRAGTVGIGRNRAAGNPVPASALTSRSICSGGRPEALLDSHSRTAIPLVLALLALFGAAPAQARSPYDGLWSVSLGVDQGSCGDHTIELFIRNGEISHAGDRGFFTADGRVSDQGRVAASIGALGLTASADGQLSDRQGSGTWMFPEWGCSGRWLAERRST